MAQKRLQLPKGLRQAELPPTNSTRPPLVGQAGGTAWQEKAIPIIELPGAKAPHAQWRRTLRPSSPSLTATTRQATLAPSRPFPMGFHSHSLTSGDSVGPGQCGQARCARCSPALSAVPTARRAQPLAKGQQQRQQIADWRARAGRDAPPSAQDPVSCRQLSRGRPAAEISQQNRQALVAENPPLGTRQAGSECSLSSPRPQRLEADSLSHLNGKTSTLEVGRRRVGPGIQAQGVWSSAVAVAQDPADGRACHG